MSSIDGPANVISSSPISIHGSSPVRRHSATASEISELTSSRARHSPTLPRSFDPNDPQVRERQRTMDVDMAMHLSRARRETITLASSPVAPAVYDPMSQQPISQLSAHEEFEIDMARGRDSLHDLGHGHIDSMVPNRQSSLVDLRPMLQQSHDPSLLASLSAQGTIPQTALEDTATSSYGLPTYQANASRANFDFSPMEIFAAEEKQRLGLSSPTTPNPTTKFSLSALRRQHENSAPDLDVNDSRDDGPSDNVSTTSRPARHRKLSQSNPHPRAPRRGLAGKMALFESNQNDPTPSILNGGVHGGPSFDGPGVSTGGILNTGHDRPYRFSFYSNALSATIHARSLGELPSEGQSFEDLFAGNPAPNRDRPSSSRAGDGGHDHQHANRRSMYNDSKSGAYGTGDSDGSTWWLDVQSPTDEEMKMLSKVFSIHPLTTEDIQMEETREKIELFRNYYLVCFRSFDQDPYSPTHLEPLNMYIIVFREGILSFHFRPTPHPQNVRRRIKQLKDYISVTSDWISYALIDDITDAFGPLIQGIEYEVDSIDELVLILKEAEQSDMLRRIGTCRKKVMGLLRLMGNKADVVKGLAKRCNENWRVAPTSDIGLYLSDIQDHLITMTQNLNHYEKILSRSHSNYLAQISIEMTDANNQINDVLSKLTALGTVLIPMNLVTGLWGMNVHVPGQDQMEGYAWFISIIACLAAFACIGGYSTYKFMVRR
ncbi:hypothetical protein BD779DRAFT_1466001 [Infundibulicybe gibba]|nr:hypothetical protein BD779DRAFT_1466001 [Infundibulicybe gibba]